MCYSFCPRRRTKMLNFLRRHSDLVLEIVLRITLFSVFWYLEGVTPFQRVVKQEELWLYKNPITKHDTVPTYILLGISIGIPSSFIITHYLSTGQQVDLQQGLLGLTLSAFLNGVVTNLIKLAVGRPRPDFFYRCFPDGKLTSGYQCSGDAAVIEQGRKSFPSGHAAWMFACFGYLSLYLLGKLHCLRASGRGQGWRLCVALSPLLASALVGISRFQDYKHHWDDIAVGGMLGFVMACLCYLHYYPPPWDPTGYAPYPTSGSKGTPTKHLQLSPGKLSDGAGGECELGELESQLEHNGGKRTRR